MESITLIDSTTPVGIGAQRRYSFRDVKYCLQRIMRISGLQSPLTIPFLEGVLRTSAGPDRTGGCEKRLSDLGESYRDLQNPDPKVRGA
jgi:hypothetical protein